MLSKAKKYATMLSTALLFSCGPTPAPAVTPNDCVGITQNLMGAQSYMIDPKYRKEMIQIVEGFKDRKLNNLKLNEVKNWFITQINLGATMHDPEIYGKLVFQSCVNLSKGLKNEL
jgi:hypothetical protein